MFEVTVTSNPSKSEDLNLFESGEERRQEKNEAKNWSMTVCCFASFMSDYKSFFAWAWPWAWARA
jgi:hypothetical protein